MGLTLDDLRRPDFGGRVWGYDRDEVDQLLATVVTSIERLQRRRQRDAAAIERATAEAAGANERAEAAERARDELAIRLELALERTGPQGRRVAATIGVDGAEVGEVEHRLAEAEERAQEAEEESLGLREELAEERARSRRAVVLETEARELRERLLLLTMAGEVPSPDGQQREPDDRRAAEPDDHATRAGAPIRTFSGEGGLDDLPAEVYARLPLTQRAARALLREARARAAAIVAEAQAEAEALNRAPTATPGAGALAPAGSGAQTG